jgi:hypothetical protein
VHSTVIKRVSIVCLNTRTRTRERARTSTWTRSGNERETVRPSENKNDYYCVHEDEDARTVYLGEERDLNFDTTFAARSCVTDRV